MLMTERSLLFTMLAMLSPTLAGGQVVQNVHGDVAHFGEGFTAITESRRDLRLLPPAIVALASQKTLAQMSREGGGPAIIDRLAPVLVPEGTLWAQYVAGVLLR